MEPIGSRPKIFVKRVDAESESLLFDIAQLRNLLSPGSAIQHHVEQFEVLATRILVDEIDSLYDSDRWPDLDRSTFKSVIVSLLASNWVVLRQVALQRAPGNPYLNVLQSLDDKSEEDYERLRQALEDVSGLKNISNSPPLVYLGPIARLFVFDEKGPCVISTPFGVVNQQNALAQTLSTQTIPHEVAHAIFEEIPDLLDELKLRISIDNRPSAIEPTKKQRAIDSVIFNWLNEIIADMAGTALEGEAFARSAAIIMTVPEKIIARADQTHPAPLLRPYIHAQVLKKLFSDAAPSFYKSLDKSTSKYQNQPYEGLPAFIDVSLEELLTCLVEIVDRIWDTELKTLGGSTLGKVLTAAAHKKVSKRVIDELPKWGDPEENQKPEDEVLRLLGPIDLVSPLPSPQLFESEVCCWVGAQTCCPHTLTVS